MAVRRANSVQQPILSLTAAPLAALATWAADDFKDDGPCVVLASPGMLQSGFSRSLFDRWCEDARNGVILAGYR